MRHKGQSGISLSIKPKWIGCKFLAEKTEKRAAMFGASHIFPAFCNFLCYREESVLYQEATGTLDFLRSSNSPFLVVPTTPPPNSIWYYTSDLHKVVDTSHGPYLPRWQTSPLLSKGGRVNQNFARRNMTASPLKAIDSAQIVISEFVMAPPGRVDSKIRTRHISPYMLVQRAKRLSNIKASQ